MKLPISLGRKKQNAMPKGKVKLIWFAFYGNNARFGIVGNNWKVSLNSTTWIRKVVWYFFICSFAAEGIEELCNQIMTDSRVSGAETWLFAVPLLHFLRGDSEPFEELVIEGFYDKPEWHGAQKLKLKEFQRKAASL